jgi:hypothetical protein
MALVFAISYIIGISLCHMMQLLLGVSLWLVAEGSHRSQLLNTHHSRKKNHVAAAEIIWVRYDEERSNFYEESVVNKVLTLASTLCVPVTIYQTIDSVERRDEANHPNRYTNDKMLATYKTSLMFLKQQSGCELKVSLLSVFAF